ncbi:hypothetical protein [Marichromatium bheemlicum]|uniref:Cytochrome c n=1 Tax=Marichromatium bheemlicum TaxID=365339 RepID=A0ABX1I489_9GAMM|nr:hypothetical protein [Marichromatium bheemlicum]NKN31891.1 hypothetical protein [Marichromatium bheemlicum]
MKRLAILLVTALLGTTVHAESAEELVAGKTRADIDYRQLMELMGEAVGTIQRGILRENAELVAIGARMILDHPAPRHRPWTIMAPADRDAFKQALLVFDPQLDRHAGAALEAAREADWGTALDALARLDHACIACHAGWRQRVVRAAPAP